MHGCKVRGHLHLRSIAEIFCKSNSHPNVGDKYLIQNKLGRSRPFSNSRDYGLIECGAESYTWSMQTKIVNALHSGERGTASRLLLDYGHGNHPLEADDFVNILSYCARSPDPSFVVDTWQVMVSREIKLNFRSSLLLLRALCEGGHLDEAFNFIHGETHCISPVLPLYNCFLKACAKMRNVVHANQCLYLMEKQMVGKNETTYTALLKLAVWQNNLTAARDIWKDYINHYSLSIFPLSKFIWSFSRLGDLKSAYETLQHMVSLYMRENFLPSETNNKKLNISRLDIPIPSNNYLGSMMSLLENEKSDPAIYCKNEGTYAISLEKKNRKISFQSAIGREQIMVLLQQCFGDVIRACAQNKNIELAEQLFFQMQNLGLKPSSHAYDGYVKVIASERGIDHSLEVLKVMQLNKVKPYDSTLAALSLSCCKALELDLAETLLNQISDCQNPHPYNAFLAACDLMNQPERAVGIFAKMKKLNIMPNIRTYELLLSLFGTVNAPYEKGNMQSQGEAFRRIKAIQMDMVKNGIQHSYLSVKNLLKALGSEGMIREVIQYFYASEELLSHRNDCLVTSIYNTVLQSLVEEKQSHMAIDIFKSMRSFGFQPDAATYNIMIDCCSIIRSFRSACILISMMIRDGFYLKAPSYTTVIKILLEDWNFDEALNLLEKAKVEKVQLDVLLYNTILEAASVKGRVDVMEYIVTSMDTHNIQPDIATCVYVFSTYVNRGFPSTAVEALQVLCMRVLCEDKRDVEEKKQLLEEHIFAEDTDVESRILQCFDESDWNHPAALLILRWCAMTGFSLSWSLDQSPWVRRLARNYRS